MFRTLHLTLRLRAAPSISLGVALRSVLVSSSVMLLMISTKVYEMSFS